MTRLRSDALSESRGYGLGFSLRPATNVVLLEGIDAGVSFQSIHDPQSDTTVTVVSNTTDGAWPVARFLQERFAV